MNINLAVYNLEVEGAEGNSLMSNPFLTLNFSV